MPEIIENKKIKPKILTEELNTYFMFDLQAKQHIGQIRGKTPDDAMRRWEDGAAGGFGDFDNHIFIVIPVELALEHQYKIKTKTTATPVTNPMGEVLLND
jgi:hypothetical protein